MDKCTTELLQSTDGIGNAPFTLQRHMHVQMRGTRKEVLAAISILQAAPQEPPSKLFKLVCFVLLVSYPRLSQRVDETDEGCCNHFIVITLYQNQHYS